MKTKILLSSLFFAVSAYSFASPTNTDELTTVNEAQNISLTELLVNNSKGRNLDTLIDVASSQSATLLMQTSIESKKGRNLDLQALALSKFMKTYEKQIAEQSF